MTTTMNNVAVFANPNGENQYIEDFLAAVSGNLKANLMIVSLSEALPQYARFPNPRRKDRLEEILKHAAEVSTKELSKCAEGHGFTTATHLLEGRFPVAFEAWLKTNKNDLIVKQTIPCDGEFGLASKGDMRLTRHVNEPLLLLHSPFNTNQPVLIGVPPTHGEATSKSFAVRVVQAGVQWAKMVGQKAHFVHAWELFGESLLRSRAPDDEVRENLASAKAHAQEDMQSVLDAAGVDETVTHELHVHKGDPARVLLAEIELLQPSLVVVGSVANDGVKGYMLGNTAETIAKKKHNNVLVVR